MNKKLLEVSVRDDGNFIILTENEDYLKGLLNPDRPEEIDAVIRKMIREVVRTMWGDQDRGIAFSFIVRILSMAEICSCAEPYQRLEEFWMTMISTTIPMMENYSDALKVQFGDEPWKKVRPLTMVDGEFVSVPAGMTQIKEGDKWRS